MSGMTRNGLAGLLSILFVVGGLIFSYGLGHAPVSRVCTEHAVSVPVDAASPPGASQVRQAGVSPLQGLQKAPLKQDLALDASLCLAVLFTLILLGLAGVLRRPAFRLPARAGWVLTLPSRGTPAPALQPSLQVLRL